MDLSLPKVELELKPRPLQKALLENKARKQVVVAHRRFGKTTFALMKILQSADVNTRFFYIAPTYRQAKLIAWQMLIDMVPVQLIIKKNEVELMLKLNNGCTIELKGADNPDSLRGVGLNGCVLDEFAMMNPSTWSEIIRPALSDRKGWGVFIGTPKGKNHFFDLFNSTPETDRCLLKASETKILDGQELASARQEMNQDEFNQEFECDFLYFSGQIYKEFKPEVHVIKNFKVDETWYQGLALDHGQVNPTAGLFYATDYDGRIIIFDEYYQAGLTVQQNVRNLKLMIETKGYNLRNAPLLDPSAFAKNRSRDTVMYSVADEYVDNGLACVPAQNEVLGGINRVKEYFENNKLTIFAGCENLIRELESYRWKERRSMDANFPDEPLKVNDHCVDALRYLILSRPDKPVWPKYNKTLLDRKKELMQAGRKRGGVWYG